MRQGFLFRCAIIPPFRQRSPERGYRPLSAHDRPRPLPHLAAHSSWPPATIVKARRALGRPSRSLAASPTPALLVYSSFFRPHLTSNLPHPLTQRYARLVNGLVAAVGALLILGGIILGEKFPQWSNALIGVGSSVLATALASFIMRHYLSASQQSEKNITDWGFVRVFATRAEMNASSNEELAQASRFVDIIAFGLQSFRQAKGPLLVKKLHAGVTLRIITLAPDSQLCGLVDRRERQPTGHTRSTIEDLINWADDIKKLIPTSEIEVRKYDALPLDFYFRVDDAAFIGHNPHGLISQQAPSYEIFSPSKGFEYWSSYFETIWNNESLCKRAAGALFPY